jgi:hypothetical protein
VSTSPASILTAAIALALAGRCAVAPSPGPLLTPSPAQSASTSASPGASNLPPRASPSTVAGAPLLVAWERRGDETRLIVVKDGAIDRPQLPTVPNGLVAAGTQDPLGFLSGSPDQPVMWTSRGSLADPRWNAQPLVPLDSPGEPLVWLCLSRGAAPRVAVQSDDNLVYLVDDHGRLRPLPPGLLMLRPGGCAWTDRGHLVVPTDAAQPASHIGFVMFDVDATTQRLVPGTSGEAPAVSDASLAYVARDPAGRQVVWIGAIPGPDDPLPPPVIRIAPDGPNAGDLDFFHPALSADGRRLAVVELSRPAAPSRLLVYDLFPSPTIVMQLDVKGASDAGPVWVANPPAD